MIVYWKLFELMDKRGIGRLCLRSCVSGNTVAKLGRNGTVDTSTIEKLCAFLCCQPGDIMSFIPDDIYYKYFPPKS